MRLVRAVVRWLAIFAGAVAGSYGGRVAAARLHGEPVEPLLRLDQAALMRPDPVPGFLAVEFLGKLVKLGPWSGALVAATAAALAAYIEGPLIDPPAVTDADQTPTAAPSIIV